MFLVTEDLCISDAAFLPRLVTGTLIEECLVEDEQLGTDGMKDLLVFLP
jgi:hypothetical protein